MDLCNKIFFLLKNDKLDKIIYFEITFFTEYYSKFNQYSNKNQFKNNSKLTCTTSCTQLLKQDQCILKRLNKATFFLILVQLVSQASDFPVL